MLAQGDQACERSRQITILQKEETNRTYFWKNVSACSVEVCPLPVYKFEGSNRLSSVMKLRKVQSWQSKLQGCWPIKRVQSLTMRGASDVKPHTHDRVPSVLVIANKRLPWGAWMAELCLLQAWAHKDSMFYWLQLICARHVVFSGFCCFMHKTKSTAVNLYKWTIYANGLSWKFISDKFSFHGEPMWGTVNHYLNKYSCSWFYCWVHQHSISCIKSTC